MIRVVQRRSRIVSVEAPASRVRTVEVQPTQHNVLATPTATRTSVVRRADEQPLYDELASMQPADLQTSATLIAVLVPVLSRPHRVAPLLESFRKATAPGDAALYFVAQRSDQEELDAIADAVGIESDKAVCRATAILVDDIDRSWARKINRGFEETSEPWMLLGADDLAFHTGWVDSVRGMLRTHAGVIGTNDLGNSSTMSGRSSTHPFVRRSYATVFGTIDERGKILHEGYDHNFPDSELVETAKTRGLYAHARNCVIEHLHPLWGKGQTDRIYQLGQRNWKADQALFMKRCREFGIGGA